MIKSGAYIAQLVQPIIRYADWLNSIFCQIVQRGIVDGSVSAFKSTIINARLVCR